VTGDDDALWGHASLPFTDMRSFDASTHVNISTVQWAPLDPDRFGTVPPPLAELAHTLWLGRDYVYASERVIEGSLALFLPRLISPHARARVRCELGGET